VRAVIIPRHGGAEVLALVQDFPEPSPTSREAVVRVAATSVNQMDLLVRNGYPNRAIPLPHVPGGDVVGTVESVGEAVRSVEVGDRVLVYPLLSCGECMLCRTGRPNLCSNWQTVGIHHHGGYAEKVAVPAENLIRLPAGVEFEAAATLPVAGLTAYHALSTVARLEPGELAVVWGAAGGLGSMAVQLVKQLGARVVAVTSSTERRAVLEKLGADAVVDRLKGPVSEQIRKLTPEGADLVFDTIGGATYAESLSMLRNGGRLVSCGILGGREAALNVHMVYYHHLTVLGVFLGTMNDMTAMIELLAKGSIVPLIDRVLPLEQAAEGQRMLETGRHVGKIVLRI